MIILTFRARFAKWSVKIKNSPLFASFNCGIILVYMNIAVGIFIGILMLSLGAWTLDRAIKNSLPSLLRFWWLPRDYAGRESLERLSALIVGAVFVIAGLVMFLLNLMQLFF
jgi:hypothetical protein